MKKIVAMSLLSMLALAGAAQADVVTMTFDAGPGTSVISSGDTLANQYADWGITFNAGGATGASGEGTLNWATNTSMIITNSDFGSRGVTAPPVSNMLHSYGGWLNEDGTPIFRMNIAGGAVGSIAADFVGVGSTSTYEGTQYRPSIRVFDATDALIGSASVVPEGSTSYQTVTASFGGTAAYALITPGSFSDWVGIDNIVVNTVPTPGAMALFGMGTMCVLKRKRK